MESNSLREDSENRSVVFSSDSTDDNIIRTFSTGAEQRYLTLENSRSNVVSITRGRHTDDDDDSNDDDGSSEYRSELSHEINDLETNSFDGTNKKRTRYQQQYQQEGQSGEHQPQDDPEEMNRKKLRRLAMNRISARSRRRKKQELLSSLEVSTKSLRKSNAAVEQENFLIKSQILTLKSFILGNVTCRGGDASLAAIHRDIAMSEQLLNTSRIKPEPLEQIEQQDSLTTNIMAGGMDTKRRRTNPPARSRLLTQTTPLQHPNDVKSPTSSNCQALALPIMTGANTASKNTMDHQIVSSAPPLQNDISSSSKGRGSTSSCSSNVAISPPVASFTTRIDKRSKQSKPYFPLQFDSHSAVTLAPDPSQKMNATPSPHQIRGEYQQQRHVALPPNALNSSIHHHSHPYLNHQKQPLQQQEELSHTLARTISILLNSLKDDDTSHTFTNLLQSILLNHQKQQSSVQPHTLPNNTTASSTGILSQDIVQSLIQQYHLRNQQFTPELPPQTSLNGKSATGSANHTGLPLFTTAQPPQENTLQHYNDSQYQQTNKKQKER